MLDVCNFSVSFTMYSLGLRPHTECAIRSLDLEVRSGKIVAIIGQSGAGKSLLAHALLGLLPSNARVSGTIRFEGRELRQEDFPRLRGRQIALIPQSVSFLNPLMRVGKQIMRPAQLSGLTRQAAQQATYSMLQRYGLQESVADFPFQLSGGMARRILTAIATIGDAKLILADEPTSGLDQETGLETLRHLRELADAGRAVLLISHNIEEALAVADEVAMFCGGVTVEQSPVQAFRDASDLHPYSQALLEALPSRKFVTALSRNAR